MADEADVKAAILDAASENSSLLIKLSSTNEAPGLLIGHEKHVTALKDALSEQIGNLEKLREDVDSKFKRHKKFRDSSARRFVYRALNNLAKFDAKAMKEERDYFALLNTQSKAEKRRLVLQQDYDEAIKDQVPLEIAAKEHVETHARIDELYETLFAGPTPGFPKEDDRENRFYVARGKNEATKEAIREARRARNVLAVSQAHVRRAQEYRRSADQSAVDSVFFLEDALISLRRGNERITEAAKSISRIEEHFAPPFLEMVAVKLELDASLAAAKITLGATFSREKIISTVALSQAQLSKAEGSLAKLVVLFQTREETLLAHIRGTARQVEDCRQELEQLRKGIFEKVAGFGEAAPAYTECCDRLESFCEVLEERDDEEEHEGARTTPEEGNANTSVPPDHENADASPQLSEEIPLRRKDD